MPLNKSSLKATVLLVEPDVLIRSKLAAYLRDFGYVVAEVADGMEAIMVLEHGDRGIQAMLTDAELLGTPDIFSLVQWMRTYRPEVKVLTAASPERAATSRESSVTTGRFSVSPTRQR
jgi:DNA-binding response OmpR family regulator